MEAVQFAACTSGLRPFV